MKAIRRCPGHTRSSPARQGIAACCLLLAIARPSLAAARQEVTPPNLLIIQTDEHNFRTLGCYRALLPEDQTFVWGKGVVVETPNIDWLATQGAVADRFYATSPVCTPSRAAFATGRYPQNTGAIRNNLPLRDEMVTFAEVLRRHGYATGYAGKWHLDGPGRPQFAPDRHFGWSDNRYLFNRGHWKILVEDTNGPRVGPTNAQGAPTYSVAGADERSFTTDFLTDRAIAFIRQHRSGPFCFQLSIPDPHGPNSVRPPYDTMFNDLHFERPVSALSPGEGLPGYAATLKGPFNQRQMALYFGMVKCIDDNVGRLLSALRETGLLERTIVIFTSDHGDLCGEHGRHNKSVPMEGSARIPFVIHAPGLIQPGTVVRQALGTVDFKPTLLSLMGVSDPTADEGRDASGLFTGKTDPAGWNDVTFVRIGGPTPAGAGAADAEDQEEGNGWMGAFTRRFKLIVAPAEPPALFDLETDPHELRNVIGRPEHAEVVRRLAGELLDYARTHHEPHLELASLREELIRLTGQ
ncbi:MAG: sulfatase-like hydrolase/transferase [Verrucomicrobiales bacterium]|nr:sulfatase-like hydrolase/transferase [Verrucomicrobiales bacterium]